MGLENLENQIVTRRALVGGLGAGCLTEAVGRVMTVGGFLDAFRRFSVGEESKTKISRKGLILDCATVVVGAVMTYKGLVEGVYEERKVFDAKNPEPHQEKIT